MLAVVLPSAGDGLVGLAELLADPAFGVRNTELGFAGEFGFGGTVRLSPEPVDGLVPELTELGFADELGFVDPLRVPAEPVEPVDWVVPKFEVPKTELGFAGELGFGGTAGLSPDLPDWLIPVFEVPITGLGFPGEFGFGGTEGVPAAPPA